MKSFLLLLLVWLPVCTQAQSVGSIQGTVSTTTQARVSYVTIFLKELRIGTTTSESGYFTLNHIKPGTYILRITAIGWQELEQSITVEANQTTQLTLVLTEKSQQLDEVQVIGNGNINETPVNVGKIAIKPMDLPQSVAVIGGEILKRQQSLHLGDALQNINGVYVMGTTGGAQEELAGRGFAFGSNNTFKNGVRYNNGIMPEVSALERIEVLKGSSAILFGNVAAGGVINLITKKPKFEKGGEIAMRAGSYGFYKPSLDLYGAFANSTQTAYRIHTTYEKAQSFRDEVNAERFYINPSFLYKIGNKTQLLLEGDYLRDNRTSDFGIGAINYTLIDVPRNRFLGVNWAKNQTEQKSATLTVTHTFNTHWQLRGVAATQAYDNDLFGSTRPNSSGNLVQTNGTWIRGIQRTQIDEAYHLLQLDLMGTFKTGFLGHQLLFGADADQYKTHTTAYHALTKYDSINVFDLNQYEQRTDIPQLSRNTLTKNTINRTGIYLQDLVSIGKKTKVLAGIRWNYLENPSDTYTYAKNTSDLKTTYDQAFTPRFGLVYQPTKNTSLFASYANSFTINAGVDINSNPLRPSFIDQYEAGIKNMLFKGLVTANVTVYQIVNSNLAQAVQPVPKDKPNARELAGEVTSKGLEVDLTTKPVYGFSVLAGYSYNDTRYTRSNIYIDGSRLRYNPSHTANASIHYAFSDKSLLKNFTLGMGLFYMGDRVAGRSTRLTVPNDTYKLIPLPNFTILDASVGYLTQSFAIRLKVSNLLNVLSYQVHDDNSVNPIAPRQLSVTASYTF